MTKGKNNYPASLLCVWVHIPSMVTPKQARKWDNASFSESNRTANWKQSDNRQQTRV